GKREHVGSGAAAVGIATTDDGDCKVLDIGDIARIYEGCVDRGRNDDTGEVGIGGIVGGRFRRLGCGERCGERVGITGGGDGGGVVRIYHPEIVVIAFFERGVLRGEGAERGIAGNLRFRYLLGAERDRRVVVYGGRAKLIGKLIRLLRRPGLKLGGGDT